MPTPIEGLPRNIVIHKEKVISQKDRGLEKFLEDDVQNSFLEVLRKKYTLGNGSYFLNGIKVTKDENIRRPKLLLL